MTDCVYLIGCRGAGKSSIGLELARRLDYAFLDTDLLIAEKGGRPIAEIVDRAGWQGFRELEEAVLLQLAGRKSCVVATGGGAVLHRDVWQQLKSKGTVVWLTADLKVLCERIGGDPNSKVMRPSLTGKNICEELKDVMAQRFSLYEEIADITVDTGKMTVDVAVDRIAEFLSRQDQLL